MRFKNIVFRRCPITSIGISPHYEWGVNDGILFKAFLNMIAIWGNKAHLTYGRWGALHSLRISGGPSNNFQRRETHSANFFNNNPVDDFGEHDPAKESENHLRLGETIPAKPSPTNKNSDEQELRRTRIPTKPSPTNKSSDETIPAKIGSFDRRKIRKFGKLPYIFPPHSL